MLKNGLIRKISIISKFMTKQPGKQTLAILILCNISRNNDNQTIKYGQFIEYNLRKIFLEKSFSKRGEEIIPRPFSKK